jgi:hypothetical protein
LPLFGPISWHQLWNANNEAGFPKLTKNIHFVEGFDTSSVYANLWKTIE